MPLEVCMNVNTDAYVTKGALHDVCEDYVLHGHEPMPFWIVADGCSSAVHSEVAAQCLCWAAKAELSIFLLDEVPMEERVSRFELAVLSRVKSVACLLNMTTPLLATLMVGVVMGGHAYIWVWGDGVVATVSPESELLIHSIEYSGNRPFYLFYQQESGVQERFLELGANKAIVTLEGGSQTHVDGMPVLSPYSLCVPLSEICFVACLSDGVDCVVDKLSRKKQPLVKVMQGVTAFKQAHGEFIQRRMKRWLKTQLKGGFVMLDDVSMAGAWIGNC